MVKSFQSSVDKLLSQKQSIQGGVDEALDAAITGNIAGIFVIFSVSCDIK